MERKSQKDSPMSGVEMNKSDSEYDSEKLQNMYQLHISQQRQHIRTLSDTTTRYYYNFDYYND